MVKGEKVLIKTIIRTMTTIVMIMQMIKQKIHKTTIQKSTDNNQTNITEEITNNQIKKVERNKYLKEADKNNKTKNQKR